MGSRGDTQRQFDEMQQRSREEDEERNEKMRAAQEERQLKQMLVQTKRMAAMFTRTIKQLQAAQKKLQKSGVALSTECTDGIAAANQLISSLRSASDIEAVEELFDSAADTQETLMSCRRQAEQMTQAPTIFKAMQRMIDRLKKAKVDVTELQSAYNSEIQSAYSALKSGASDEDIEAFFDAAESFREALIDAFEAADLNPPKELINAGQNLGPMRGDRGPQSFSIQNQLASVGEVIMSLIGIK